MSRRANKLTAEELNALVEAEPATEAEGPAAPSVRRVDFADLDRDAGGVPESRSTLNFLMDVPLEVRVVLGQTRMTVREVLELGPGAVVELDKAYAEPVDVYLNGRLVARGEVVVAGENFGVKVTEIISDPVAKGV